MVSSALHQGEGQEEAPGEEPDKVERPIEIAGQFVVVDWIASTKEAEEMLVDEVEPEEAMAIHASGIANAGENVPRSGDHKEHDGTAHGFEAAPATILAREGKIDRGGSKEKDDCDESLG